MSKHTPGPWEAVSIWESSSISDDDAIRYGIISTKQPLAACVANKTNDICTVWYRASESRTDANARLIAAAPEMYEALNEVASWMLAPGDSAFPDESLERICRILAKVEGR